MINCKNRKIKSLRDNSAPYPHRHSNGLAFSSTQPDLPLTLRIVNRELERTGYGTLLNGDLTPWANQGVFLLNTVLTCEEGKSLAHKGWGWEEFTGYTLKMIGEHCKQPFVVMAWGRHAQDLIREKLDWSGSNCEVLTACHPVAESWSGGRIKFVGCGHFAKANNWLADKGQNQIAWTPFLTSLSPQHVKDKVYGNI